MLTLEEAAPATEVHGFPQRILRSEGLVLFAVALAAAFRQLDHSWWLVPVLLFVPDLFMAGYARSTRIGAAVYNLGHSYPAPALLGAAAVASSSHVWEAVALIWFAHIGMDRTLGFGLKYGDSFKHTHLGWIK
ncbi:MAG: hypothetical protein QOI82_1057 [Actinomycetota bacterium]|jgi:hypothetical protein|nr:hypothetical protein [Actinomycetota bacterium]